MAFLASLILAASSISSAAPMVVHSPAAVMHPAPIQYDQYQLPRNFKFEINSVVVPNVQSVGGISDNVGQTKSGDPVYRQQVPGKMKWSAITLKRGMTTDNSLFEWRMKVIEGKVAEAYKTCTLDTTSPQGKPVEFIFQQCWPSQYQSTAPPAGVTGHGSETITLNFQKLEIKY